MPLIHGRSKKAFSKNVEAEMHAGKPLKQSLAIAYSVKRKNAHKKMAKGGSVDISAASEKRPMIDDINNSEDMMDGHPVEGSEVTSEKRNFHNEGEPSIDSAITPEELAMLHKYRKHLASGGPVEVDFASEHMEGIDDAHTPEDMNMLDKHSTRHHDEIRAASGMPDEDHDESEHGEDMLRQHEQKDEYSKKGIINYARGGEISPEDEENEEKHASLAAAIMAKKKRMASGGEVDLQDMNGNEHMNEEDDMSFEAGRKKTYYDDSQIEDQPMDSNEHGDELSDEDSHDMVSKIRSKMRMKRG